MHHPTRSSQPGLLPPATVLEPYQTVYPTEAPSGQRRGFAHPTSLFVPGPRLGSSALASEASPGHHKGNTAVSGSQALPEQGYYTGQIAAYPSPCSTTASRTTSEHQDPMAVHAGLNRHAYVPLGTYNAPQANSPTSAHSSHHDVHNREIYAQGFGFSHQTYYSQPSYALPAQAPYGPHADQQAYTPVTLTNSSVLLSQQRPAPAARDMPSNSPLTLEQTPSQTSWQRQGPNTEISHGLSPGHTGQTATMQSTNGPNASAAPGPIPATTPLVVRQDQNGVQWIVFEYSRDRVKMEYVIRCDVESVSIDDLGQDFKSANCVYPRACGGKDQYKGNRLHYESECNAVGWALADLNPMLREKRGLIQRAVDSWRNSNQNPRLRSRRVRRQAKISDRKARAGQSPGRISGQLGPVPLGHHDSGGLITRTKTPTGRLHHHHSGSDGNLASTGSEDVSASNEVKASMSHHHHTPSSQPLSSPVEVRPAHDQYSAFPLQSVSNSKSLMMHHEIDSQPSTLNSNSSWIKEEGEDKTIALFGDVPEGKRRKFILVDDHARGTRVRVRVLLDSVKMEEMPDSHLRTNSVFPRSYYPRQMNSPPASPGRSGNWDDCDSGEESVASSASERARTTVQVVLLDGSQSRLRVPRMSRMRRRKELALNELGYRMSWSQAKTFNERPIFMQKSLDAYRDKTRSALLASGQDSRDIAPHFETRVGKRKWLSRYGYRRGSSC